MLFVVFTGVLAVISGFILGGILDRGADDLAVFQGELRYAKGVISYSLLGLVMLIAPALTAGAVVTERARRSIDLLQCTLMPASYFLIGKLIGAYRYLWVLLLLTIPFTASTVVFGGATAWDIFAFYWYVSCIGLLFAAAGLLASAIAETLVKSVVLAYVTSFGLAGIISIFVGVSLGPMLTRLSGPQDVWQVVALLLTGQYASIDSASVALQAQGLALFTGLILVFVALFVAGSASAYVGRAGRETAAVRIVSGLLIGLLFYLTATGAGAGSGASPILPFILSIILLPKIACFGSHDQLRFHRDGIVNFRQALVGRPSGALPYILIVFGVALTATAIAKDMTTYDWWLWGYMLVILLALWLVCRWTSVRVKAYSAAAGLSLLWLIILFGVLPAMASAFIWQTYSYSSGVPAYDPVLVTPYGPFAGENWTSLASWLAVWFVLGMGSFFFAGEWRRPLPVPPRRLNP